MINARGPREVAISAASRGWLDMGAIWDIARRYERQGRDLSLEELFSPYLAPEMLEELCAPDLPEFSETVVSAAPSKARASGPSEIPPPEAAAARYTLGEELGVGGSGRVLAAFDQKLGRPVAFKVLRAEALDAEHRARFLHEVRLTARLEHPGIIPIYDVESPPGQPPFYTMRVVKHRSLQGVLRIPPPRKDWPLSRLCSIFIQVCRALAYAHSHGIIHRDIKPENILLGDYGEVYVADWGIAKILGENDPYQGAWIKTPSTESQSGVSQPLTEAGTVLGTIGYMAPEQVLARWDMIDHRADLFSLGVILYQILTGKKPFRQKTAKATLDATLRAEPVRPRALWSACPLVLEELCLKLLAKRPEDRPPSAEVVANEIEAFLEGSKEKERRRQVATRLVERANAAAKRCQALQEERVSLLARAKEALKDIKPFAPLEQKHPGWRLEDQARAADVEQARALAEAAELYSQALALSPDVPGAKDGLALLYLSRVEAAEAARDEPSRIYYESLVLENDEDGRYRAILKANARLTLQSAPLGAEVLAYRYVERDRILRPELVSSLGKTPLEEVNLPPGSYLLILKKEGFPETRYPVLLRRGEHLRAEVRLYKEEELGEGFLYIPAGPCTIGGDREAVTPLPREEIFVPGFAIGRLPVTLGEYLEFLNHLQKTAPAEVEKRLPRELNSSDFLVRKDETGRWVPSDDIVVGDGLRFCSKEDFVRLPITSIDWFDAVAYCRFRSERDGVFYRLPTEVEYEKAARGVDERFFPWGDFFDPAFCKTMDSRPGFCQPEPAGAFEYDESPYGVRDLAGSMRCWVADIYGELSVEEALAEPEEDPDTSRATSRVRIVRGGSWIHPMPPCRAASRNRFLVTARYSQVGFRLVRPLP